MRRRSPRREGRLGAGEDRAPTWPRTACERLGMWLPLASPGARRLLSLGLPEASSERWRRTQDAHTTQHEGEKEWASWLEKSPSPRDL